MSPREVLEAGLAEETVPRANGSIAFDEPWQGRALAMAVLVVERSGRGWDDFRRHLIAALGEDTERPYWESWVRALDRFVRDVGLLAPRSAAEPRRS
ncbi:MAG TPA: hypothetical protein VN781_03385 [Acidimicrobiales bacterium]|nr:hypothetical protein [Acidimicrobiales bacterium]